MWTRVVRGSAMMPVCLLSVLGMIGCSGSFLSSDKVTATPNFSPGGGTYNAAKTVNITSQTSGAVLYCTTDGTTPTTTSPQCAQPTTVNQTEFLQAIAVAPGKSPSAVASAAYTISLNAAATPTFSPAGGSYTSAQQVTISDTVSGANIYYTTDGTTVPTTASMLYTGPITVSSSQTISAIAAASGYAPSAAASAAYTISLPVAAPVFSLATGNYTTTQTVTISDATQGATIYYAMNGGTPSSSSTPYNGPITVDKTQTISAIAVLNGSVSAISQVAYTISSVSVTVPPPAISPSPGIISVGAPVTITDNDSNATIYYTLDGSTPSAASGTQYTGVAITFSQLGPVTVSAIAIDGAGNSSTVASVAYTVLPPGNKGNPFNGTVISGKNPVKSAQVQVYAAGLSDYGANPTQLGAPVMTDDNGSFSFSDGSYTCRPPSSTLLNGDLVYLVAIGGDTGSGTPNTNLELMTALGPCGNIANNASFVINEATTVASAYALSAFMTTAPNVGSSSTNYLGLSNAFGTVNNLVDITTGDVLTTTPAYAKGIVPFLNTSTVPQARINTLANILNGCAGSDGQGAGCSNLFSDTTLASSSTPPGNTLQAILNIAQHPGEKVSDLFGLASPSGPFQPALPTATTALNDWTLALTFTGAGLGISPDTLSTPGSNGDGPIVNTSLAIDATGNVWVTAYGEAFYTPILPVLAEFNNLGAPLTPTTTLSADAAPVVTYGGINIQLPSNGPNQANFGAIDKDGNVWVSINSPISADTDLTQVSRGQDGSITLKTNSTGSDQLQSMAIDSGGNIWATTTITPTLDEFDNTGKQKLHTTPTGDYLSSLIIDSNGYSWVVAINSGTFNPGLDQNSPADGESLYTPFSTTGDYLVGPTLAAGGNGNVYACAQSSSTDLTLDVFQTSPGGTETPGTQTGSYPIATGRGCGNQLVLDGLGNLFAITNYIFNGATIDEFTISGSVVSPASGYTGTSSEDPPTINPDINFFSVPGTSAAIDGSGNLWVLNSETSGADANFNPRPGNVLVEFIGIAAPVVTPTSVAVTNGSLGSRP